MHSLTSYLTKYKLPFSWRQHSTANLIGCFRSIILYHLQIQMRFFWYWPLLILISMEILNIEFDNASSDIRNSVLSGSTEIVHYATSVQRLYFTPSDFHLIPSAQREGWKKSRGVKYKLNTSECKDFLQRYIITQWFPR